MQRKVGQDVILKKPQKKNEAFPRREKILIQEVKKEKITPKVNTQLHKKVIQRENILSEKKIQNYNTNSFSNKGYTIPPQERKTAVKGGILWFFVICAFLVLIVTLGTFFARARIAIVLEQKNYPIDVQAILAVEPQQNQILFKTIQVRDEQSIIVPSTEKQSVNTHAKGKVRLFSKNKQSTFIPTGTLLTSSQGKNFKTITAVTVPGIGGNQLPGHIDVEVQAEQSGGDYNGLLDDFVLPHFSQIMGRSLSETAGGNTGEQFVISEAQLIDAKTSVRSRIERNHPFSFLVNQVPEQYRISESLVDVSEIVFHTENIPEGVKVSANRTIMGVMFAQEDFLNFLEIYMPESEQSYMDIFDASKISIKLADNASLHSPDTILVNISGSFEAQARFDKEKILSSIARKKKNEAITFLQSISGVKQATITIFPPWATVIPDKISRILFTIDYKNE